MPDPCSLWPLEFFVRRTRTGLRLAIGMLAGGGLARRSESIWSLLKHNGCDTVASMFPANPRSDHPCATSVAFHTTHWTIVLAAREKDGTAAQEALASLCSA